MLHTVRVRTISVEVDHQQMMERKNMFENLGKPQEAVAQNRPISIEIDQKEMQVSQD